MPHPNVNAIPEIRVLAENDFLQVVATITRPNDALAYAAGDAVTNSTSAPVTTTFAGCARYLGGSGLIATATLIDSANQATKGVFELWLFNGNSAPAPDNDNAVFTPTDAELANLVGVIQFNTAFVGDATAGAGGNAVYHGVLPTFQIPFICGSAVKDLYGLLVVRNAYTPVNLEAFTIILNIIQD